MVFGIDDHHLPILRVGGVDRLAGHKIFIAGLFVDENFLHLIIFSRHFRNTSDFFVDRY
jgi:hypothetical protein